MAITEDEQLILNAAKKAKELLGSETWRFHSELLGKVIEAHLWGLASPAGSMDGLIQDEFRKGTLNGLRLSQGLFDETIAQAEAIRKREESLAPEDNEEDMD